MQQSQQVASVQPPQQQQQQHKATAWEQIVQYRNQLAEDLQRVEVRISDLEAEYLNAEYSQAGTVLKGFDGFLSSKDALRKRVRVWKPEDRIFSLSSKSSPVTREIEELEQMEAQNTTGVFGKKGYAQKGYAQKGKRGAL